MTQQIAQSSAIILDDSELFSLEKSIKQELTIIEELETTCNDRIYVAKVLLAESINKMFQKNREDNGLLTSNFPLTWKKINSIDDHYKFTPDVSGEVLGYTKSGVMSKINILGGNEQFIGKSAFVDSVSNRLFVQFSPLFATKLDYVEMELVSTKSDSITPLNIALILYLDRHLASGELTAFMNELSEARSTYTAELSRVTMAAKYQDNEAW
jgi:hypothetical protein